MPRTHLLLACLLLSAATSGVAQTPPANVVTPAPPPREGTVGPEQLRDFSLPGTRQAPPAAEPAPAEPPVQTPQQAPAPTPRPRPPAQPAERAATPPARQPETGEPAATPPPAAQATVESGAPTAETPPVLAEPLVPAAPAPLAETPSDEGPTTGPWWPWLLLAALAGIALALVARRHRESPGERPYEQVATSPLEAGPASPLAASAAPQAPFPPAPEPALPTGLVTTRLRPATAPPRPAAEEPPRPIGAVVSTGLRPRIELDVAVEELLLTQQEVVIRFRLNVSNNGSASARDISVEALALNAGEDQAARIGDFFARPGPAEVGVLELPRLGARELVHEVRMNRDAVREYEVEGRRLFVPLLAFLATYRWSGGRGRTGAAFLLGHEKPGSDRLAPLRLDEGPVRLAGLGVRRLHEQVRA